eukprot:TRINITY_DN2594_c0_g1_i2.p1 TRINITY_DN2594_c0_g1~~TRINITY_DN2594_c0_g1_i2.p1  ORF type:complete len:318 (-),score=24.50 TRINITY_DN2594_c0_g1_i2:76-1005(-)
MNPTELLASEFVISDFEELPKELVVMVIYFLDLVDVCTLRKTCTFFRTCIDFEEESIYRRLLFRRYGQSEVWKTEDGLWKDRFIDLYLFRFSTQHCTPTVKLADGRREATKTSDQAYGVVVGDARLAAGRHFWEVQVMQLWRSQCVCIGIVNDPVQAVAMESNQHGMFGHFEHGWGLFQDGDRCHDGAWIQPRAPPFRKNDRIGLQVRCPATPPLNGTTCALARVRRVRPGDAEVLPQRYVLRRRMHVRRNPRPRLACCVHDEPRRHGSHPVASRPASACRLPALSATRTVTCACQRLRIVCDFARSID